MERPIVGIIGNSHLINDRYRVHGGGYHNSQAVSKVAGCTPVIIPADPEIVGIEELMSHFDGFLLTGGRANVHPEEYGHEPTEAHGAFDRERDRITLPLIRALTERGQPYFGVCRGFQEVNVAFGGTLHPEIRELPGRMNHRMPPDGTEEQIFELRQRVTFTEGGPFHRLLGDTEVMTNTLHGQGVDQPGARIVIDGWADDGTPEALYVDGAPGFTLSAQWHPEYNAAHDPVSRVLFGAFGDAVRDWAGRRGRPQLKSA
ncbi:gamma-glutamyl-gamma-aminobutyrate hydrolase family protein [Psychromarinibacter sp. C21-152]|uniref:gamma-glutamyl-gamma-aminobutyrate hydrolase n=1 Tax=Psychromarinibacter sediminicola TaxID=3033385 RepID=A0AAE3T7N4_9RHOB|nr:gamma-glutamyl-gamma-aminobutyrate hydrolase family protein [Psychromarinibacter sediminicola]MDF0599903.1 gamma-glutamyl-gamma-aminobutyrate hydrolase family protein [Psychromarinibacter sediminicola]